jgi:hypothetical protein
MATIHHNTLKRAAKFGLILTTVELADSSTAFEVIHDGVVLSTASDPKDALDLAILAIAEGKAPAPKKKSKKATKMPAKAKAPKPRDEEDVDDEEDIDDEEDAGKSVVKPKYRTKYRPHKMTCGDALSQQIRREFMTKKDPDSGKPRLDWVRFTAFAKANDCWDAKYAHLNPGMKRMNVVNRLRAKIAAGVKIKW